MSLGTLSAVQEALAASAQAAARAKEQYLQRQKDEAASRLEEQQELKLCVVCQDRHKSVLLLPCRHLCVCAECADSRMLQQRCPMCRTRIQRRISVFA